MADLFDGDYISGTLIPKDWAEPLGLLLAYHSYLETKVEDLIADILGIGNRKTESLINQSSQVGGKLSLLLSLGGDHFQDQNLADFLAVHKALEKANSGRNRIVHNKILMIFRSGGPDQDQMTKLRFSRHGRNKDQTYNLKKKDVIDSGRACLEAGRLAGRFRRKHFPDEI